MEKKIIAIVVAFVVLIAAIVIVAIAIDSKKDIYVDKNGVEHWIYRDSEGNTELDANGNILVYATDENGKRQRYPSGEYIKSSIEFPEMLVDGNTIETPDYKLTIPEGWKLKYDGAVVLEDNENIEFKVTNLGIEASSIDIYMEDFNKEYKEIFNNVLEAGEDNAINYDKCRLTEKNFDCRTVEYKVFSEDGALALYTMEYYFISDGEVFKIYYRCLGDSYDETINIIDILNESVIIK